MKVGDKVVIITTAGSRAINHSGGLSSSSQCFKELAILVAVDCLLPTYPAPNRPYNNAIVQMCKTKEIIFIHTDNLKPTAAKIEVKYFCDGEDVTDKISEQTKRNLIC